LSFELVFAAFFQSLAFSYEPYINIKLGKSNVFKSIGHALTVDDVLEDAHNNFIKDMRMDEILEANDTEFSTYGSQNQSRNQSYLDQ